MTLNANTTYSSRFELVFKNLAAASNDQIAIKDGNNTKPNYSTNVTGVEDQLESAYTLAYSEQGYSLKNENGINGDIKVMDVTGKTVWTKSVNNSSTSVLINLNQNTTGIYFIEVINNNERIYGNKILKQ